MPRLVRCDGTGPQEIKPQEKSVWICMCGLSKSLPTCDGSHKTARQEDPEKLYVYDRSRCNVEEVREDQAMLDEK
ncbi:CDGSH iron-sulfur domain-containing protein [Phycisphaerales bacterium AB-hyl4]|uniref:CDGSH iron-sulfur domain-containing protein n=1 Tax=Natronomicrosphaera hydrolytica TaxID=3242702 RepID=A0ABV4U6L8_9BACT